MIIYMTKAPDSLCSGRQASATNKVEITSEMIEEGLQFYHEWMGDDYSLSPMEREMIAGIYTVMTLARGDLIADISLVSDCMSFNTAEIC